MATRAVESLLEGEAEALTRKAIELAKQGDLMALRLCLERICSPRRERHVRVELPPVRDVQDVPSVLATVIESVAAGDITPGEGQSLATAVENYRRAVETVDHERRLAELESR